MDTHSLSPSLFLCCFGLNLGRGKEDNEKWAINLNFFCGAMQRTNGPPRPSFCLCCSCTLPMQCFFFKYIYYYVQGSRVKYLSVGHFPFSEGNRLSFLRDDHRPRIFLSQYDHKGIEKLPHPRMFRYPVWPWMPNSTLIEGPDSTGSS